MPKFLETYKEKLEKLLQDYNSQIVEQVETYMECTIDMKKIKADTEKLYNVQEKLLKKLEDEKQVTKMKRNQPFYQSKEKLNQTLVQPKIISIKPSISTNTMNYNFSLDRNKSFQLKKHELSYDLNGRLNKSTQFKVLGVLPKISQNTINNDSSLYVNLSCSQENQNSSFDLCDQEDECNLKKASKLEEKKK